MRVPAGLPILAPAGIHIRGTILSASTDTASDAAGISIQTAEHLIPVTPVHEATRTAPQTMLIRGRNECMDRRRLTWHARGVWEKVTTGAQDEGQKAASKGAFTYGRLSAIKPAQMSSLHAAVPFKHQDALDAAWWEVGRIGGTLRGEAEPQPFLDPELEALKKTMRPGSL
ncbi:hypothetical protein [Kocuria sp. CPCC 205263]|uniref:hypothetical protein n=1 Tax=Kocuria sp. CPCC 205263 TaxID=3073555 RepID=UPI0034D5AEDB